VIYLARHGQTDWNLFMRFNGRTDTFLNQTGINQAKSQAEILRNINFEACYCSSQTRARQYCEIIYNGLIMFDDRLNEIDCGEFEGMEETAEAMKLFWQAIQKGDKGTESFNTFIKRNCDLCDLIMDKWKERNVLVVTHAANTRIINYYFTGKPFDYDFNKVVVEKGEFIILENS